MNEMKDILLPGEPDDVAPELSPSALMLFAPVDKRAFGIALGVASAVTVSGFTLLALLVDRDHELHLDLLSQYFPGYGYTAPGIIAGALWAFGLGFCAGWFTAFVRNLVLAVSLFLLRSRAELSDSRDFLDHI